MNQAHLPEGKVEFKVPGIHGKDRPRASVVNGHIRMYTPAATTNYERAVAAAYKAVGGKMHPKPQALSVTYHVYDKLPKSRPSHVLSEHNIFKPDIDNVAKILLDGLNGVAFEDDTQVIMIHGEKRDRTRDIKCPYVEVVVCPILEERHAG